MFYITNIIFIHFTNMRKYSGADLIGPKTEYQLGQTMGPYTNFSNVGPSCNVTRQRVRSASLI